MSGKELKEKLKETGISQAEIARRLGVIPETIGQALTAKDIKTGFLEDLCRILGVDMSFFYDIKTSTSSETFTRDEEVARLREEVARLREELRMKEDPDQPRKESEVYRLWMEHMRLSEQLINVTDRMRELYQNQKEG